MADESMQSVQETVLMAIARHINCLGESNRNTRKRALEGIRKEVILRKPSLESTELQDVFSEIVKPLLKIVSDPVEKCRDLTVNIISHCVKNVSKPGDSLSYVIPVIVQRLGQPDIIETSEEVRLELVNLLSDYVRICQKQTGPYVDDFVKILQRTVADPYPEVKKESCKCVASFAAAVPEHFHLQSESMIKPLLTAISHQHSRVRVEVILAIGNAIQYGNNKSVDDVVSHLAQRLFDQAPSVRAAVTQVVGNWLLDLMDRYSFFHKLIPLLLTSTQDEMPDIQEQAEALWHDVGLKYERENENDLKDKMDFTKPDPEHYPKGIERPNLGCRTLMYHHFSKMLSGINNDISDWVAPTRVKSAQLLYSLLLNMEENCTMHLEKVVHALAKGSTDEEADVVAEVKRCSELVGYFVPPEVWVKMVLKQVKLSQSPGLCMVLAGVIRGSQRQALKPYLPDICNVIGEGDICQVSESRLQNEVCSCVASMIAVSQSDCGSISLDLFTILLSVLALARTEAIAQQAHDLLSHLAASQSMDGVSLLYSAHSQQLIDNLKDTYATWTQHSTERLLFDTLLMECGPVVGELLDSIMPMLVANLNPQKDPEVRLKFFNLLSKLMLNAGQTLNSTNRFCDFCVLVIRDMIIPNLVWHAGRTASAIRTVAASCLWALLQSGLLATQQLSQVAEPLLIQLKSTMEDDNNNTRLVTCRVITHLFKQSGDKLDQDKLHQMYPDFLKRLDDSSDDVRVATCGAFSAYVRAFSADYQVSLYRAHYEAIYRGLLVHLDDPDKHIQLEVLDVLKTAAVIDPSMLLREVDNVKHKHRSTHYCDLLTQYVHALPKPQN